MSASSGGRHGPVVPQTRSQHMLSQGATRLTKTINRVVDDDGAATPRTGLVDRSRVRAFGRGGRYRRFNSSGSPARTRRSNSTLIVLTWFRAPIRALIW